MKSKYTLNKIPQPKRYLLIILVNGKFYQLLNTHSKVGKIHFDLFPFEHYKN